MSFLHNKFLILLLCANTLGLPSRIGNFCKAERNWLQDQASSTGWMTALQKLLPTPHLSHISLAFSFNANQLWVERKIPSTRESSFTLELYVILYRLIPNHHLPRETSGLQCEILATGATGSSTVALWTSSKASTIVKRENKVGHLHLKQNGLEGK